MPSIRWDGDSSGAVAAQEKMTKASKAYQEALKLGLTSTELLMKKSEDFGRKGQESHERVYQAARKSHQAHEQLSDGISHVGKELLGMAAGLVTVEKGVEFVTEAFKELHQEALKAAQASRDALETTADVVQTPDSAAAIELSRNIVARGLGSEQQANAIAGGLSRARVSEADQQLLLNVAQGRGVKASDLPTLARTVQQIVRARGGTFAGTLDVLTVASQQGRTTLQEAAEAASGVGLRAKGLGLSLAEQEAAFAAIAPAAGGAAAAGTDLEQLFNAVGKKKLGGGTLDDIIGRIEKRAGPGGRNLPKLLGRPGAVEAARVLLQERAAYRANLAAGEGSTGAFGRLGEAAIADPRVRAAIGAMTGAGEREETMSELTSERENLYKRFTDESYRQLQAGGAGGLKLALFSAGAEFGAWTGGEESALSRAIYGDPENKANREPAAISPELARDIRDYLRRIHGAQKSKGQARQE